MNKDTLIFDLDGTLLNTLEDLHAGFNYALKICGYKERSLEEIRSFVPGYDIGGKTGTAQKYENGVIASGKYVSSFVGIYPADKPEYILLIAVDEPSAGAYYGSLVAAPYGKMFFERMFQILNIAPQDLEEDLQKVEKNITVPNLVGMGLASAIAELVGYNLQYEIQGEGEIVKNQILPAGSKTYKDDIVLLIT